MTIKRLYIAGPISRGDQFLNVRNAFLAASQLRALGYYPFVPHATCFWHMLQPDDYEKWMEYDFVWIAACDALVRIEGYSPGSDREVEYAQSLGLPVYFGVQAFVDAVVMPATNGSGGASLPTFNNLAGANAHAVVRTKETGHLHLPKPQGNSWVVVAAVRHEKWEDEPKADSSVAALVEEFDKRLNGGKKS